MNTISLLFYYLFIYPIYKIQFGHIGARTKIRNPLRVKGKSNISIGDNVIIQYKTWLESLPLTNMEKCNLKIGNGSTIGNFNHIYCTHKITIGNNVLTADKVYIADNSHTYENPNLAVVKQPIRQLQEVNIGDGVWIGENVCIIGASIGENSVIGANSVVTKNIPSHSIAVGNPAYIIKRYNFATKQWEKTDKKGNFI